MVSQRELDRAKITFLAPLLPKPSEEALEFLRNPFPFAIAFKRTGKRAEAQNLYWCGHGGETFKQDELTDYRPNHKALHSWNGRKHVATCPHCGMHMEIEEWQTRAKHYVDMVVIPCTFGSWKIERYFEVDTWYKVGRPEETGFRQVGSVWHRDGQTHHYFARQGGLYYSKYWKLNEPFHFTDSLPFYQTPTQWEGKDRYPAPKGFNFDRELRRRGIDKTNLHGIALTQLLELMNAYPYFETLWKEGEWKIAKFFKKDLHAYARQIQIARRHGYKIADLNEWRDMVDFLRELHKDDYEILWVLRGRVRFTLPNETHLLEAGQSIQFDALLCHAYEVLEDCELFIAHLKKNKRF